MASEQREWLDQFDNPDGQFFFDDQQFAPGNNAALDHDVDRVVGVSIERHEATCFKLCDRVFV